MANNQDPLVQVLNGVTEMRSNLRQEISKLPAPSPAKEMLDSLDKYLGTVDYEVRNILMKFTSELPRPQLQRLIRELPRPKREW